MQSWKIFVHSMRMVFNNLGAALRISGLLYLAQIIVATYFTINFGDQITPPTQGVQYTISGGFLGALFLNLMVTIVISLWIAVAWHRFILLNETPAAVIPKFEGNLMLTYFWKSFLLGLMVGLIMVAMMTVAGLLLGEGSMRWIPALLIIPAIYIFYRYCLILPAAALGVSCSFSQSYAKTKPAAQDLFWLALIVAGAAFLVEVPGMISSDPASYINLIYTHVLGWFVMMGGVSILSTLYGVYFEGREI